MCFCNIKCNFSTFLITLNQWLQHSQCEISKTSFILHNHCLLIRILLKDHHYQFERYFTFLYITSIYICLLNSTWQKILFRFYFVYNITRNGLREWIHSKHLLTVRHINDTDTFRQFCRGYRRTLHKTLVLLAYKALIVHKHLDYSNHTIFSLQRTLALNARSRLPPGILKFLLLHVILIKDNNSKQL